MGDRLEQFKSGFEANAAGGFLANLVHIAWELNLYEVLIEKGPLTSNALAKEAGIDARYCQELCLNLAAQKVLDVESSTRVFSVPKALENALQDSCTFAMGSSMIAGVSGHDRLVESFRTGAPVPWGHNHPLLFGAAKDFFGPLYRNKLVSNLPEKVRSKLENGATLVDIGCGEGVSCIVLAQAFPNAKVIGVDGHKMSIECAQKAAAQNGKLPNLSFIVEDAAKVQIDGKADIVAFFDSFHDMCVASKAASNAFNLLKDDGCVLLIEMLAADEDSLEQQLALPTAPVYTAFSCHFCTPCGKENDGDALGTVVPTSKHREIFQKSGFQTLEKETNELQALGYRMLLVNK